MIDMNVTAKHGQAAVHLGGSELTNGRWTPACRIQHHNTGGREMNPLRPTDKAVTCKRCLKLTEKAPAPAVDEHAAAVARMRANREAEEEERAAARRARNRTNYGKSHPVGRKLAQDHGLNFF